MIWTEAELAREIFLRDHHDLISPWAFPLIERLQRAKARLIDGWNRAHG